MLINKKEIFRSFLIFFLLTLILIGCSIRQYDIQYPSDIKQFNGRVIQIKKLRLSPWKTESIYDSESTTRLDIKNESAYSIFFDPGYGICVYGYTPKDDKWFEFENMVRYYGPGDLLQPKDNKESNWIGYVSLNLKTNKKFDDIEKIRICIVGEIVSKETQPDLGGNCIDVINKY